MNTHDTSSKKGVLAAGTVAQDFILHVTPDQMLSLGELRGKPVILAFFPADWSPVCGDQMGLYNEVLPEFQKFGAVLLGISVDGPWCHRAFTDARHLHFPLLADFEPKGLVSKQYGAYRDADGTSERALFVIGADGKIAWSYCSPVAVNPGADGILDALEKLLNWPRRVSKCRSHQPIIARAPKTHRARSWNMAIISARDAAKPIRS
jgi:peroxiredoxin